jgi:hypothetical protein
MPIAKVQLQDGRIARFEVPDGTTPEQVTAFAQSQFNEAKPEGVGVGEGIAMGAGDPVQGGAQLLANSLPSGIVEGVNNLTAKANELPVIGPFMKRMGMVPATAQQVNEQVTARENEYQGRRDAAGQTGTDWARIGGNVLGTLPVAAALPVGATIGGAIAAGGASGAATSALQPVPDATEDSYGTQKGRQVVTGAGYGAAFGPLAYAAGRLVAPQVTPEVRKLADANVRMTPGQILGGAYKSTEDALTSIPLLGDAIKAGQRRSVESFNDAALNRVLEPIGKALPKTVRAGRDAINYVDDAVSSAYQAVLPKMRGATDQQYSDDVLRVWNSAIQDGLLPEAKVNQFKAILQSQIFDKMGPSGLIDGTKLKQIDSQLGYLSRQFRTAADSDNRFLGTYVGELQSAFRDMLTRVNPPELSRGLSDANKAFANLIRVERAAAASGGAADGVFTPAQLSRAVQATDTSARKANVARGTALMQDLSDAAKNVLPSSVPDSGTPLRGMLGAAALGYGGAAINPGAAMVGPAVYGAYTSPGQRLIQALLTGRRSQPIDALGKGIANAGVSVASPLAAALANSP